MNFCEKNQSGFGVNFVLRGISALLGVGPGIYLLEVTVAVCHGLLLTPVSLVLFT